MIVPQYLLFSVTISKTNDAVINLYKKEKKEKGKYQLNAESN